MFSVDNKYLVLDGEESTLMFWDLTLNKIVLKLEGHEEQVTSLNFSPNG